MRENGREHCVRCATEVDVQYRYPRRLRRALIGYLCLPLAMIPAFPFLAADYVVSLPLMMVYMLGIGPVLGIVREPPSCSVCGALVGPRARPPTPSQA